jgi:hypothetical protein
VAMTEVYPRVPGAELRDTCNGLVSTDCGSVRAGADDGASVTARTS